MKRSAHATPGPRWTPRERSAEPPVAPAVLPPFSDPDLWEPWAKFPVTMPVKVALEAHGVLVKHLGHAGVRHCACPLARAACAAWDGPGQDSRFLRRKQP